MSPDPFDLFQQLEALTIVYGRKYDATKRLIALTLLGLMYWRSVAPRRSWHQLFGLLSFEVQSGRWSFFSRYSLWHGKRLTLRLLPICLATIMKQKSFFQVRSLLGRLCYCCKGLLDWKSLAGFDIQILLSWFNLINFVILFYSAREYDKLFSLCLGSCIRPWWCHFCCTSFGWDCYCFCHGFTVCNCNQSGYYIYGRVQAKFASFLSCVLNTAAVVLAHVTAFLYRTICFCLF